MNLEVVIVDDDEIVNFLHQSIIKDCGLSGNPKCFLSSLNALEYIKSKRNENTPFLILLDIYMPEMDGWELLNKLLELYNNDTSLLNVYLISSTLSKKDKDKARHYDLVKGFIEKPLGIQTCKRLKNSSALKSYL